MVVSKFHILFIITIVLRTSFQEMVYGEDYLLYPSQDGSNNLVPAFLKSPNNSAPLNKIHTDEKDIHFYLYTPSNPTTPIEISPTNAVSVAKSKFFKNAPLKILCHGFASSYTNQFPADTRIKYLAVQGPINVITIDWKLLALPPLYITASNNVELVAIKTAELINILVEANVIPLEKIHFVGHSLGAHGMAIAARRITSGKVARVTGLDPAKPLWEDNPNQISPNVAQFVDIIHSNGLIWGLRQPLGLVDFYPNGGDDQVGCDQLYNLDGAFGICSHDRSYEYFTESIVAPSQTQKFSACLCENCDGEKQASCFHAHALLRLCQCDPVVHMGEDAPSWSRGSYYLQTNAVPPYSKSNSLNTELKLIS